MLAFSFGREAEVTCGLDETIQRLKHWLCLSNKNGYAYYLLILICPAIIYLSTLL